jgi:hypothetical protein
MLIVTAAGCAELDVGSDVLWTARFETGSLSEWTGVAGGAAEAFPLPPNMVEVSNERAHGGVTAAKLTITSASASSRETAQLTRAGGLPADAYYSAWYYVPVSVNVGTYWVIFKFRTRDNPSDPATAAERFDLDLKNMPNGEMTLHLYDHRTNSDVPLAVADPVIPVGSWFHIEAHYRDTPEGTGRATYWLDGRLLVDVTAPALGTAAWVEWSACSIGENLSPATAVLYIDDCAVSRTRVGPTGVIARD